MLRAKTGAWSKFKKSKPKCVLLQFHHITKINQFKLAPKTMKSVTTVATLFAITGLTTTSAFNAQPNYGRHSHANTASYNSLRDMAAYPETFNGPNGGVGGGAFGMDGDWRTGNGYSQGGPGMGFRDMETNPYYNEGWGQESRMSRGGGPSMGRRNGGMRADGFDPYGPYSPAMGMSRSDRRLDQGDLFMNSDSMGMRSDRTMRGFTYSGRNREYGPGAGEAYDPGMMFEMMDGPPGMMGPGGMMDGPDMGMMGGGMGGRMGP